MHRSTSVRVSLARLGALVAIAVLVGACSSGSGSGSGSGSKIEISGAWARESAMVSGAGAAYMVIKNTGSEADSLLGGSSPAAKSVEVHETVTMEASPAASSAGMGGEPSAGMGGASPAAAGGMMGMQKVDKLEIPANGSVELKPGSYHLMLIELTAPLKVGEKIDITLKFEKAGDVKVTAEVKAG